MLRNLEDFQFSLVPLSLPFVNVRKKSKSAEIEFGEEWRGRKKGWSAVLVRCAPVSWLNRGTNKRSHYTWCINKSRQPIIRFDLRPQPARLLLQAGASGRALEPYLRAAEYIIPKISVRTIREKASNNTDGGPSERAANILAAAIASFDLRLDVTRGGGEREREFANDSFSNKIFSSKNRIVIFHIFFFLSYNLRPFRYLSEEEILKRDYNFTARESGYLIGGNSRGDVGKRSWNFEVMATGESI